jgi:hypothetical protein
MYNYCIASGDEAWSSREPCISNTALACNQVCVLLYSMDIHEDLEIKICLSNSLHLSFCIWSCVSWSTRLPV